MFINKIQLHHFTKQDIEKLKSIYNTVDDIDLFIGAMTEKKVDGSLLGPTFLCLIGDQMSRLRKGDRFFYEEGGNLVE